LRLHLRGGRAGPFRVDDHHLDGEGRIFGPPKIAVGAKAGGAEQQHHEQHQRAVRDRPLRKIDALHDRLLLGCG
jgi:hypothetical protein